MDIRLCFVVAALLFGSMRLESQVVAYSPKTQDEVNVVRVENEWVEAAISRDEKRLNAIFADGLIWNEDGIFRNKMQVLRRYMVEVEEKVIELRNVRMKVEGDTAVVASQIHVIKTVAGKTTDSTHESVDVFRKISGR